MRTLLLASLLALGAIAQVAAPTKAVAQTPTFTISTDTVYLYGPATATELSGKFNINKVGSGTLNMQWDKSFDVATPAGWTDQFCDLELCHGESTSSATFTMNNSVPGGPMKWLIAPAGIVASTTGRLTIYPVGDFASAQTVVFIISTDPLGTDDAPKSNLVLSSYPNPATTSLTVTMPRPSTGARMEVYNLIGSRVATWYAPATGGTTTYDVSNLAQGGYILRLATPNGPIMSRTFSKVN